jgi:hypothetical protein
MPVEGREKCARHGRTLVGAFARAHYLLHIVAQ